MTAYAYQPYWCEENIWQLAGRDDLGEGARRVVFVSNAARQVALWEQKASREPDGLVVWDYHVVLLVGAMLWDLDSRLGHPVPVEHWLAATFRTVQPQHAPTFRVIDADVFRRDFASDRSHMKDEHGHWRAEPPAWPAIGVGHTLPRFIDMNEAFVGDVVDLDGVFAIALLAKGQGVWPQVSLSAAELAAHIGACAPELDVDRLCAEDLYLAAACALGRPAAVACFRAAHLGHIEATLRGLGVRPSEIDELAHVALEAMLVGDEGDPAIAHYSGRGTLRRWVRSVAIRTAAKRHRSEQLEAAKRARLAEVMTELDDDLEVEHLKLEYAPELEAALTTAIATLDVRDRNLLHHYFIDGLTVDEIGRLFDVHRATAARWVAKARELLHTRVLDHLQRELGLSPSEVDSLGRFVRSQVDVSFSRLLHQ